MRFEHLVIVFRLMNELRCMEMKSTVTFMTTETNDERSVSLNTLENTVKKEGILVYKKLVGE